MLFVVKGDGDSVQFKKSSSLPAVKSDSASGVSVGTAAARGHNALICYFSLFQVPVRICIKL